MGRTCGDSPNCVSSFETRKDFSIKPFLLKSGTDPQEQFKTLIAKALELPRTKLVKQEKGFAHLTFRSLIFRFVDDVFLWLGDEQIDIRSASRVGYSDLGVNRKRVEELRRVFESLHENRE